MTHLSLCTGYAGLDLGLGVVPTWVADVDPVACRLLAARLPDVPNLGDITTVDWSSLGPVDTLTAGFPCQPFSHAGNRRGSDDERHLWPHIVTVIRILRPRRVILENVAGHLSLGFEQVLADLASIGFAAEWAVVRASDVGACHRRARLFVVAASDTDGTRCDRVPELDRATTPRLDGPHRGHADRLGGDLSRRVTWGAYEPAIRRWEHVLGRSAPDPVVDGDLSPRFVEWMMGLPDGWVTDLDLSRNAQLRLLGNGVVPLQAGAAVGLLERRLYDVPVGVS